MATATKTPAKRATSQTNAATAVKSTRTSARAGGSAVKNASSKAAGAAPKAGVRAAATTGAAKKATLQRALNGSSAHAPVSTRAKTPRAKSNGALPAELAGDVQELARVTQDGHEGEV